MSKYKNKIIIGSVILITLLISFFGFGNSSSNQKDILQDDLIHSTQEYFEEIIEQQETEETKEIQEQYFEKETEVYNITEILTDEVFSNQDYTETSSIQEQKETIVYQEDLTIEDEELTCTLSIRCDTILNNMGLLSPEKIELIPSDGIILPITTVLFYEGESVFNVLIRELKKNKIHFEFKNTPLYNSAYIEGIANIYEFDCGELSGWMYRVNGVTPNYGCSQYKLKNGDEIEWVYTCDLGNDI